MRRLTRALLGATFAAAAMAACGDDGDPQAPVDPDGPPSSTVEPGPDSDPSDEPGETPAITGDL